jgi:hypothetical protein
LKKSLLGQSMVPNRAQNAQKWCPRYPNGGQKERVKEFFNSLDRFRDTSSNRMALSPILLTYCKPL